MVQVTCEKTGVVFEAATRRTKNHPTIMGWLNEAASAGWYKQALTTIQNGREQGFTTIEQFVDALRSTEVQAKAANDAAYAAEQERKRDEQEARRDRFTTNAFLREHGYKWKKYMNDEEDVDLLGLPEYEWTLYSPDHRIVSVKEAILELAYADVKYAKEWLAKHNIAEELPAIEKQRQAELQAGIEVNEQIADLDEDSHKYVHEMTERLMEAGLTEQKARKEALRLSRPHSPQEDEIPLGPVNLPNGRMLMLTINGDGRYGFTGSMGLWTGLQEVLDLFPDDTQLHEYLAPYVARNARDEAKS